MSTITRLNASGIVAEAGRLGSGTSTILTSVFLPDRC